MSYLIDLLGLLRESVILGRYGTAETLATDLLKRIDDGETFEESAVVEAIPILRDMDDDLAQLISRLNWRLPPVRTGAHEERGSWVSRADE